MAITMCPECGGKVSDKASSCVHCGFIIKKAPGPFHQAQTVSSENEIKAYTLKCPYCGIALQSNNVNENGWMQCPSCQQEILLSNIYADVPIEKIYPHEASSNELFHEKCMYRLIDKGPEDVFKEISNIEIKHKYIWIKEFGRENSEFFPMSNFGINLFKSFEYKAIPHSDFFSMWYMEKLKNYDSSIIYSDDIDSKGFSASECRKYYRSTTGNNKEETDNYYCMPIYEETFEYKSKKYCIYGMGDFGGVRYKLNDEKIPELSIYLPSYLYILDFIYEFKPTTVILLLAWVALFVFLTCDGQLWWLIFIIPISIISFFLVKFGLLIDRSISDSINNTMTSKELKIRSKMKNKKRKDAIDNGFLRK